MITVQDVFNDAYSDREDEATSVALLDATRHNPEGGIRAADQVESRIATLFLALNELQEQNIERRDNIADLYVDLRLTDAVNAAIALAETAQKIANTALELSVVLPTVFIPRRCSGTPRKSRTSMPRYA